MESDVIQLASARQPDSGSREKLADHTTFAGDGPPLNLAAVIASVYRSYPLLEAARSGQDIAAGNHLVAHGAFDTKLKGASENGAVGFYQTYRQNAGFEQPTMWGGSVFGGYRIGRGDFQPWYLERQTDDGGEFKAGVIVPLLRDVGIDARRAELWKTSLGREVAATDVRLQTIDFVRAASYSFWEWVAAGRRVAIAESLLKLAQDRNSGIRRKVEEGDTDPPVLQDNQRLIVSREAKLIDEQRKLRETAVKLSLFYRDAVGEPMVVGADPLPTFPDIPAVTDEIEASDIQTALSRRPELPVLDLIRQQLEIDFEQADNERRPDLRVAVVGAKDVGEIASKKGDKRPLELEGSLYLEVPLQRRKALGKLAVTEGKLSQVAAKRRMTADKIVGEVRIAHARLQASRQKIDRVRESLTLAERMEAIERRLFELGRSDLLAVNLREQQTAEARVAEVESQLEYFAATADRAAATGRDQSSLTEKEDVRQLEE